MHLPFYGRAAPVTPRLAATAAVDSSSPRESSLSIESGQRDAEEIAEEEDEGVLAAEEALGVLLGGAASPGAPQLLARFPPSAMRRVGSRDAPGAGAAAGGSRRRRRQFIPVRPHVPDAAIAPDERAAKVAAIQPI